MEDRPPALRSPRRRCPSSLTAAPRQTLLLAPGTGALVDVRQPVPSRSTLCAYARGMGVAPSHSRTSKEQRGDGFANPLAGRPEPDLYVTSSLLHRSSSGGAASRDGTSSDGEASNSTSSTSLFSNRRQCKYCWRASSASKRLRQYSARPF